MLVFTAVIKSRTNIFMISLHNLSSHPLGRFLVSHFNEEKQTSFFLLFPGRVKQWIWLSSCRFICFSSSNTIYGSKRKDLFDISQSHKSVVKNVMNANSSFSLFLTLARTAMLKEGKSSLNDSELHKERTEC